ncbi:hypothetical protein Tco_1102088 [Tanacetum coccineum]
MATDKITLDVRNDSVVVHIVKPAYGADMEDPQLILLAKGMERSNIREHVELVLTSAPEQPGQFDCQESDAHGRIVDSPNG